MNAKLRLYRYMALYHYQAANTYINIYLLPVLFASAIAFIFNNVIDAHYTMIPAGRHGWSLSRQVAR